MSASSQVPLPFQPPPPPHSRSNRGTAEMPSLSKPIPAIANQNELASFLEISEFELKRFCLRTDKFYSTFEQAKSSGKGVRIISAPSKELKAIQKKIKQNILDCLYTHESATGYSRGCSNVHNASVHVGQKVILNLDIENFFSSISISRVVGLFMSLGYEEGVSFSLARLSCLNHVLPQGAPSSPSIANLVCHRLDRRLSGLAKNRDLKYSRYCDDISISSADRMTPGMVALVKSIINEEGFTINKEKTRLLSRRSRQIVTGLSVNEKVSIPRPKKRILRATFHRASFQEELSELERQKLLGMASYCRMVGQANVRLKSRINATCP